MAKSPVVFAKKMKKDERGTTGILFAMLAVPLFALMGVAVEYARVLNSRETVQQSLDAAVLAARNSDPVEQAAVAQKFFKSNLKKGLANATATFQKNADGDLEGTGVAYVRTPIAGMVNKGTIKITAFALARPDKTEETPSSSNGVIPCMHVMDQSGSGTLTIDGNENVNAGNCTVRVRSNHNASAMYEKNSSNVRFGQIRTKGYAMVESGYGTGKFVITNEPHTVMQNQQIVGNPYDVAMSAVSRQIAVGACNNANTGKTLTGNVSPGTYCGATEFKNATLAAGVYVIKSGSGNKNGALKLSGNINGSAGVTFYFADNKSKFASYSANEGSVLKAPEAGLTRGVLFMENSNRGAGYDFKLSVCKTQSWTGMIYLPSVNFSMEGLEDWPVMNVALAANQVVIKGWDNMTLTPYAWTPSGYTQPIMLEGEVQISRRDGWLME